ncbi:MAG: hypothetical protein Q8L48_02825 [Archangium sp.]|nr:hypothetical protein [Archangium sp.]
MTPAEPSPQRVASSPPWIGGGLVGLCLALVVFSVWRDAGSSGHVFADEYSYSHASRLAPLAAAPIPSYLYLWLFSATNACGEGWLTCARLLNALLFAGALPFIYLVCRRYSSWKPAAVVVAATAASPLTSYTAYFMPESTYFFGVWVLIWLLTNEGLSGRRFPLVVGAVLGLLALVKVHAFFLVPAVALWAWVEGWKRARSGRRLLEGALSILLVGGSAALVRFGGGWLMAGAPALSALGALYGDAAAGQSKSLSELVVGSWQSLWSHLQALAVIGAAPLAAVLSLAPVSAAKPAARLDELRRLQGLLLVLLVPLLLIVAVFTAKITGASVTEDGSRLHMRYYNFLIPLMWIVVAAHVDHASPQRRSFSPWFVVPAVLIAALGGAVMFKGLDSLLPILTDAPELRGITRFRPVLILCLSFGLATLFAWALQPRLGGRLYLFGALPLITLASSWVVSRELRELQQTPLWDASAAVTRQVLGKEGVEHVEVVTWTGAGGFRALFVLDNHAGSFVELPEGSTVPRPAAPRDWLLLVGKYVVSEPHQVIVQGDGYSLVHLLPLDATAP